MKVDGVHEKFIYHPQEPCMLLPDSSLSILKLEKGKMCGGNTRAHGESPSTMKRRTQEGCHDTQQGVQCSQEFLSEIHSTHQGCHISCDKFSSCTGNLNLQYGDGLAHRPKIWRSRRENKPVVISKKNSALPPPFVYLIFISLPFIHHIFVYSFSTTCFCFPSLHVIK
jgi:hypothetical protein